MSEVIRRANAADVSAIKQLTQEAYAPWMAVIGREPLPMSADHEAAVRDHIVDLFFYNGTLAALIEMVPKDDHLLIESVAVAPLYQGQGYGRRLLDRAEQFARSLSLQMIRLYTNKLFSKNIDLYIRLGYTVDREESFGNGHIVHLSKAV